MALSDENQEIVHWAAQWFRIGSQLRQRCGWCGAVLIDVDLSAIAMPIEQAEKVDPDDGTGGVGAWETGAFVAHDGGAWWVVDPSGEETPEACCTRLPHEVTGLQS